MRDPALLMLVAATLALPVSARASAAALELRGSGVQIYVCAPQPSGFSWKLKAPEANLFDVSGAPAGRHFAGPSWQARDGSTVTGEVLASSPAPQPGAIPWLLLRVKTHAGGGVLATVAYVTRTHTEGGQAPAAGCDAAHVGAEHRVAYNALYVFFRQP